MSRLLSDLDPAFLPLAQSLIEKCAEAGHPVAIVETRRSLEQHEANVKAGKSWTKRSKHCLTPDHQVLTSDLLWKPGGDIRPGENLLAFEDEPKSKGARRQYVHSLVLSVEETKEKVYRVIGRGAPPIRATGNHLWLVDSGFGFHWVNTTQLRRGPKIRSSLVQAIEKFKPLSSFDVGWLAGFIDGEGSLASDGSVSFAQRPGSVLDRAIETCKRLGYSVTSSLIETGLGQRDCMKVRVNGDWNSRIGFLGSVRPMRLLSNLIQVKHALQGTMRVPIEAIEAAGTADIIRIQTTSGTFIADGLAMHNCDGLAIDVCPKELINTPGWVPDSPVWETVGEIGEALGLRWGGRWKQRDMVHFEMREPGGVK